MNAAPPAPRRRRALIAGAAVSVIVVGAVWWTLGPGGPVLVSQLAQGRAVWRLGSLQLEGVSGTSLGDLKATRATLSDERGVWAEARDITLGWSPLRMLGGDVVIEDAAAARLHIYRRPILTAPRPPGRSIDLDLSALRITRLDLEQDVFGEAAAFHVTGALAARGTHVRRAGLIVTRLDAPGDSLTLDLTRNGALSFNANVAGPAEGFFAKTLGATADVAIAAQASGNDTTGAGRIDAKVGEATFADGRFAWTADGWSGDANIDLRAAPAFVAVREALGPSLRFEGRGARGVRRDFTATLTAAHAGVEARGRLGENWHPDGATQIAAHADRLEEFTPGVSSGAARFEGALTLENDTTRLDGRLSGVGVRSGAVAVSFNGPLRMALTRAVADIDADLGIQRVDAAPALARLARNGRFTLDARYHRTAQRFDVTRSRLVSPNLDVAAQGALGESARGLSGRWSIAQLSEADRRIGGAAEGAWTLSTTRVLTLDGGARQFTTTLPPLDTLLGASPRLEARLDIGDGVIDVRRFDIAGAELRFGAVGPIRNGNAALRFEASAQGPVSVGAAQLAGVADATGTLTGELDDLAVDVTARMSTLDVAGLAIEHPDVTFKLAPTGGGERAGRVAVVGAVAGEPATAHATLHADDNGLTLRDLDVAAAGFSAKGEAAFTDAGPRLDLALSGALDKLPVAMSGRVTGVLKLMSAARSEPVLTLDAHVVNGRVGELVFSRLDAKAEGPLDRIAVQASVRGAATGQPVSFDARGVARRDGDLTRVSLEGSGTVAGSAVATRGPVALQFGEGSVAARGAMTLDDGVATIDVSDAPSRLSLSARLENAPIAPIFAFLGERATGRADGTLAASGNGHSLAGAINMTITDALFARLARDPVTMRLDGDLANDVLTIKAQARSRNGLDAAFDARAPVDASARPLRVALAGEGRATWRAKGPADALWGIVGSLDQQVAGDVDGSGTLRFASGRLSGDGALTLANGRFADKQSGIDLREVSARIGFRDDAARLEQFSARDAGGGTLTGTGRADGVKNGQIDLIARNVRLLGRPDARATASGPLTLNWTGDGATLTGDLAVAGAQLAPPRTGAQIPVLDVIEINRPTVLESSGRRQGAALAVTLDVRVRAPGRVFLRGRGLDSEWAVDLRVRGPVDNPRVFGTAELVRGRFTLAGRPFDAERGLIRFNGSPEEALIDLVAELTAPEITARVALSGSVSDPDIQLSSTPALPEDEILPQALFGRASEDLSALEAAQLAASLAELAGQASLNIAGAARELVGLDRLDVRETGVGLRIAGGKYLTRDVYLEVARTGVGETETQVEWRVRPKLYLISAFQPNGDRRLSVRWRREY